MCLSEYVWPVVIFLVCMFNVDLSAAVRVCWYRGQHGSATLYASLRTNCTLQLLFLCDCILKMLGIWVQNSFICMQQPILLPLQ